MGARVPGESRRRSACRKEREVEGYDLESRPKRCMHRCGHTKRLIRDRGEKDKRVRDMERMCAWVIVIEKEGEGESE